MESWATVEPGDERCIAHTTAGATLALHLTRWETAAHVAVLGPLGVAEVAILTDYLATLSAQGAARLVVDVRGPAMSREASSALARAALELDAAGGHLELIGVDRRSRLRLAARRYLAR